MAGRRRTARERGVLLVLLAACVEYQPLALPDACDEDEVRGPAAPDAPCARTPEVEPVADPWRARVKWTWNGQGLVEGGGSYSNLPPLVGDTAEGSVVLLHFDSDQRYEVALDGQTGTLVWSVAGYGGGESAIADVDGDGELEALVHTEWVPAGLASFDLRTGIREWQTEETFDGWSQAFVADLEGDGAPEVLAMNAVLSGLDGSTKATLPAYDSWSSMVAADLDLDGVQEVLSDGVVYAPTGEVLWEAPERTLLWHHDAVLVQRDADPEAEVEWVGFDGWYAYEHDGTPIVQSRRPNEDDWWNTDPGCVGDLDGDGVPERIWRQGDTFSVNDANGRERWSYPRYELADPYVGCALFDFDADGALELLFVDRGDLVVLRGADGAVNLRLDLGLVENQVEAYPVVADLDGDGHAEVLVAGSTDGSEDAGSVLTVLEHDGAGWPPAGPDWTQWEFALTNGNLGGVVPRSPMPSWLAHNSWRSRPAADPVWLADLRLTATRCSSRSAVRVAVENRGAAAAVDVQVVAWDGDREVERQTLPVIGPGERVDGLEFSLHDVGDELRLTVETPSEECRVDNNELTTGE